MKPFAWFDGRHDDEIIDTTLSIGTLRRLTAIAKNNNNVDVDDMDIDNQLRTQAPCLQAGVSEDNI